MSLSVTVRVVDRPGEGMAFVEYADGVLGIVDTALWTKWRVRKARECPVTGRELRVGEFAYGPASTGKKYRTQRIAVEAIEGGVST